jgi:hypothetical protein
VFPDVLVGRLSELPQKPPQGMKPAVDFSDVVVSFIKVKNNRYSPLIECLECVVFH